MNTSKKQWDTPEMIIHGSVEKITAKTNGSADVPYPEDSPTLTASEV